MANSNEIYNALKQDPKVESVEFVGAGIGKVTLKSNFGNESFQATHGLEVDNVVYAPTAQMAKQFVDGAVEMVTVNNLMTGKPVRQRADTPRSCDVSSELYWSM